MVSVYDLKPRFQSLLRPATDMLAEAGVTANMLTVAAVLLSILGGIILLFAEARLALLVLPTVLLVRMALNAMDGMLAREHGQKTARGALLNELGDVVSDAALYLPLAVALAPFGASSWLIVLFVVGAILTEFAGVAAELIGAERRYDGPMGKSDRAAAIGLLVILLAGGAPGGWWVDLVIATLCLMALSTVVNRCRAALAQITAEPV